MGSGDESGDAYSDWGVARYDPVFVLTENVDGDGRCSEIAGTAVAGASALCRERVEPGEVGSRSSAEDCESEAVGEARERSRSRMYPPNCGPPPVAMRGLLGAEVVMSAPGRGEIARRANGAWGGARGEGVRWLDSGIGLVMAGLDMSASISRETSRAASASSERSSEGGVDSDVEAGGGGEGIRGGASCGGSGAVSPTGGTRPKSAYMDCKMCWPRTFVRR